jgi:hypothetical protein
VTILKKHWRSQWHPGEIRHCMTFRKHMYSNTEQICDNIDQLLTKIDNWEHSQNSYRANNVARLHKDGYTRADFDHGLRELAASLGLEPNPRPKLFQLSKQLCSAYLNCDSDERAEIRDFVAQRECLRVCLCRYARHLIPQINSSEAIHTLRIALAALSIENCSFDFRDTLTTIADLHVSAEQVGIDAKPIFEAIGQLSTATLTSGGCDSVADIFTQIESLPILRERRKMRESCAERLPP